MYLPGRRCRQSIGDIDLPWYLELGQAAPHSGQYLVPGYRAVLYDDRNGNFLQSIVGQSDHAEVLLLACATQHFLHFGGSEVLAADTDDFLQARHIAQFPSGETEPRSPVRNHPSSVNACRLASGWAK